MAVILDWPEGTAWWPRDVQVGVRAPKAAWESPFTEQRQSISHLADRLRLTLELRPCSPEEAGEREAFINSLISQGAWVRLWHMIRPTPLGTLRGAPTIASSAAAGVRTVAVQGVGGDTLRPGDVIGAGGVLLPVGLGGAVANGLGVLTVPLQLPTRTALAAGAPVVWLQPTGTFELTVNELAVGYGRGRWQRAVALPFREVL